MRISILLTAALAGPTHQLSPSPRSDKTLPALQFRPDGTFRITVFSDLHLGEAAQKPRGRAQDFKTIQVMSSVLEWESPDFVVLNGDLVTGEAVQRKSSGRFVDLAVAPLVERNLTWGSAYGDHDHAFNLKSEKMLRREARHRGSRTRKMVGAKTSGTSNYHVPVYAAACADRLGRGCEPLLLLWFFDSRGGARYRKISEHGSVVPQPSWVDGSVVEWFSKTHARLAARGNGTVPSLVFVHMPTGATAAARGAVDPRRNPGVNDEPASPQSQGWCAEDAYRPASCGYGGFDAPFLQALAGAAGIAGVFHAHDHGNTWCHRWEPRVPGTDAVGRGLNMCYGQRTGYGGYGSWARGGRQIVVTARGPVAVETHIRLEDGSVVGRVRLNSTFGQDRYGAAADGTRLS
ncbi:hypothetical protein UVI_02035670 [Ustilaginoidea virens]|uniref:Calcineurin-like phosphoesterase domain-containing protein n=1 Tax=Ustilaginoidea virens TaxID=1159556 RepID=A0A1B5KU63_USTVR|nr:hypothetical protein UVI_02035670 [Ustilaginoidea virens]